MKTPIGKFANPRKVAAKTPVQFEESTSDQNRAFETPTAIVRDGGAKRVAVAGINRGMPSQVRR